MWGKEVLDIERYITGPISNCGVQGCHAIASNFVRCFHNIERRVQ